MIAVHDTRARLSVLKGELYEAPLTPLPRPVVEQLRLGDNHGTVQARVRAVAAAVRAGTFRGRDGTSRPFQARHREVAYELALAANKRGEVWPRYLTARSLALELERDYANVCRDVRDLEAAGIVWRRPVPVSRGLFVYWLPGMVAPDRP